MDKKRIEKIDFLSLEALNNKVFSGAVVSFSKWNGLVYDRFSRYYGFSCQNKVINKLDKKYFFDIASLTKPLSTVLVLLSLFDSKIINIDTRLGDIYPNCPRNKRKISVKNIMSHRAGFVSHRKYFYDLNKIPEKNRKEYLLEWLLNEEIVSLAHDKSCYSDLGYMLLGLLIEKVTGKGVDVLSRNTIYKPLGLHNDLFFPQNDKKRGISYVDTGRCLWSNKRLSGFVHDDNCRALGGVAGHAGLFATLSGVMTLCEKVLDQWKDRGIHPAYSNTLLKKSVKRVEKSNWTMGFDMVSSKNSSAGNYFSKTSVGHLGFTGTSFWIDPEKECIIVLLTNRVCYGNDNWQIKKFRPILHDILMENR